MDGKIKSIIITLVLAVLLISGLGLAGYINSNYVERGTNVSNYQIKLEIRDSDTGDQWTADASIGYHYYFTIYLKAYENVTFFLMYKAYNCTYITDVAVFSWYDSSSWGYTVDLVGQNLTGTMGTILTMEKGQEMVLDSEIVFNSMGYFKVGFYTEEVVFGLQPDTMESHQSIIYY